MSGAKFRFAAAIAAIALAAGAQASAQMSADQTTMVGGAAMYPSKTIAANVVHSKDHTTLVAALKAASLVDTLAGPGPFTVFAPTNEAFAKLPAGSVHTLLKAENKDKLVTILTYHVVAGRMTAADIGNAIRAGGGRATLTTVEGEPLIASMSGDNVVLTDAKGGVATVTIANVTQSNGVVHVVNAVLMP